MTIHLTTGKLVLAALCLGVQYTLFTHSASALEPVFDSHDIARAIHTGSIVVTTAIEMAILLSTLMGNKE
ncbi:MAG: hypothetical protein ABL973_11445 [Micropepsaceae bacterium]